MTASANLRGTVQVTAGLVGRDVLIRPYTDADEAAVIALWQKALADAAPHNDPALAIRKKREAGDGLFLVAEADGTAVGTVMGGYDGHRGWVYALAVAEPYRRHGVGSALVRHLEAALADRGCLKVNLQVRASNVAVVGFYQALGYGAEERVSMGKRLY
jgi:ribosomal protein S18 acetylase RimI-like enzyme